MKLPEFLKEYRAKHALTQEQMAAKLECSVSHYKNVERGVFKAGANLQYKIGKVTRKSTNFIYNLTKGEE